jgi:hypothetical protein
MGSDGSGRLRSSAIVGVTGDSTGGCVSIGGRKLMQDDSTSVEAHAAARDGNLIVMRHRD